jgi:hypothetical protein
LKSGAEVELWLDELSNVGIEPGTKEDELLTENEDIIVEVHYRCTNVTF